MCLDLMLDYYSIEKLFSVGYCAGHKINLVFKFEIGIVTAVMALNTHVFTRRRIPYDSTISIEPLLAAGRLLCTMEDDFVPVFFRNYAGKITGLRSF